MNPRVAIAQLQFVGGQRNRLADHFRREPFGQRLGHRLGGLCLAGVVNRVDHLCQPVVVRLVLAERLIKQPVFLQQLRQQGADARHGTLALDALLFRFHTISDRLAEHRVRLLGADKIEQGPGPMGQHDAMHVGVILHDELQMVVGVDRLAFCQCCKYLFSLFHVRPAGGRPQQFSADTAAGQLGRIDRPQHLALASAVFLDVVGVAEQHLEHGQRLSLRGQILRHLIGRREGH